MKQTEIIKELDEAIRHIAENRHPEDEGRAMEVAEMLSKIGIAIASHDVQDDTAVPLDKAKKDEVVGYITLPVKPMMLKGWTSGSMPMLYNECTHALQDTETKKRIIEVGGAMGGSVHLDAGDNTFTVRPSDLMIGFLKFMMANPQYYDVKNKAELEAHLLKVEKPKRGRNAKKK